MRKSDSIKELFSGMVKLRLKLKQPPKNAKNPFYHSNYVTLEGVQKAIDDAKPGTGIDYMQFVETINGQTGVSTLVFSSNGEWILTDIAFLRPQKNDPQGVGSTLTYIRRYQLSALFGVSSELDDDANNASDVKQQSYQAQQQRSYNNQQYQRNYNNQPYRNNGGNQR